MNSNQQKRGVHLAFVIVQRFTFQDEYVIID